MQIIKRLRRSFFLRMVTHVPMPNRMRCLMAKWGGVTLADWQHAFIGEGVIFDSIYPENIYIGWGAHITMNCILLTHSLITDESGINWKSHHIHIGDKAFIGANSVIVSEVSIGDNTIIGAGAVVTKNIPSNEIWAGNPARFIKKRRI